MKILLDTHIFLWLISGDSRLPEWMKEPILNLENEVYLSIVSLWEIIVKYQLGKLPLPSPPEVYIPEQRENHMISTLSLDEESVVKLALLPDIHRDPFDRMLVCQALSKNLVIATIDPKVQAYPVPILKEHNS